MPAFYHALDAKWVAIQKKIFMSGATDLSNSKSKYPSEIFEDFLIGRFLLENLASCTTPVLPDSAYIEDNILGGCCIVEVVHLVNIGPNDKGRKANKFGPHRTLKVCFTDGYRSIYGFEFEKLPQFDMEVSIGSKVLLRNVPIRHGLLLLTAQNCSILGIYSKNLSLLKQCLRGTDQATNEDRNGMKVMQSERAECDNTYLHQVISKEPVCVPSTSDTMLSRNDEGVIKRLRLVNSPESADQNAKLPFQYLKFNAENANAIEQSRGTGVDDEMKVKGFIKSVVHFYYESRVYDLKVEIEDGSNMWTVCMDSNYVEHLIGINCERFIMLLKDKPKSAQEYVLKLQFSLMTLEGIMSLRLEKGAQSKFILMSCRDVELSDVRHLLRRVKGDAL